RAYTAQIEIRRLFDVVLESFAPHPTGFPDGSKPGFASSNLVVMDSFNRSSDPWLPGDAATTSANNPDVSADLDASGDFSDGDVRPRVTAGRVLDDRYDPEVEPVGNPEQANAGSGNDFF